MRLAMRLPPKKGDGAGSEAVDPRERESAEIIDLASRAAFPAVTDRKAKGDSLGLAVGVALVALLGATTFWAMNSARTPEPEGIGNPAVAPPQAAAPATVQPVADPALQPAQPQPDPAPAPVLANNPAMMPGAAINPYASPQLVFDASRAASASRLAEAPLGAPAGSAGEVGRGRHDPRGHRRCGRLCQPYRRGGRRACTGAADDQSFDHSDRRHADPRDP